MLSIYSKWIIFVYLIQICNNLPCPECSEHATKFLAKITPSSISNKTEFKKKLESEVKKDKKDKKEDVNIGDLKEFNFHQIPGGSNNWRSAQITAELLPSVIKKYKIKNIIRMSGDDEKHMGKHTKTSTDTEKKICEENDCTYHFINSHSGFKGSNHLQLMSSCKYFIIPNSSFACPETT